MAFQGVTLTTGSPARPHLTFAPGRQRCGFRRFGLAVRTVNEEAQAATSPPAPSQPAAEPAPTREWKKPENSYDEREGGYEAGTMPILMAHDMSPEERKRLEREQRDAPSCLLVEDEQRRAEYQAEMEDWVVDTDRQLEPKHEALQSTDGMVGNYEFQVEEKRKELQEAAEDYDRILAELTVLERAAGMYPAGESAAGGGAISGAEAGEGAGVEDLE